MITLLVIIIILIGSFVLWNLMNNKNDKNKYKQTNKQRPEYKDILSYDPKDENKIMMNIKKMTVKDIAEYADKITKKYAKNNDFLKKSVPANLVNELGKTPLNDPQIKKIILNPTTLGNAAYVATYSSEPYKSRAKKGLMFLLEKI